MTAKTAVWIWKPLASTAFVVFAWRQGAWETVYGRWVLIGLILSWLGDVLLIPEKNKTAFLLGLASFLLAHIAYGLGFLSVGTDVRWAGVAAVLLLALLVIVGRWLLPHVGQKEPGMKVPVMAYMVAVSVMVALASGAAGVSGNWRILLGGGIFYLSDISVARDKFVSPGWPNKAWGLPAYYAAQFILASTC